MMQINKNKPHTYKSPIFYYYFFPNEVKLDINDYSGLSLPLVSIISGLKKKLLT